MATHKVPQNVEAEDKLVGFLSLKQFIFVILGIGFGWLTFVFATKIHPLAALLWIPPAVVFLVLGLYQRKDQPVEVFLASALQFYFKPRTRKWDQEGFEERVIITAPPKLEKHYTKNFTGEEATSRLKNLSHLMDSRGWTTKIASEFQNPQLATAAASDRLVQPGELRTSGIDIQQYTQAPDVMDANSSLVARDFQSRINETDSSARQHALQTIQSARAGDDSADTSTPSTIQTTADSASVVAPTYQQYPQMHQKVVSPTTQETPHISTVPTSIPVEEPQQITQSSEDKPPEPAIEDGSVEIKLR